MSSSVKVNESPNHFMVLDAVARGVNKAEKIAGVTKINKAEVEMIVNDLATQRLVNKAEKRGFFGGKKLDLSLTETGNKMLIAKKQELEQKAQQMQQWYNNGNKAQLQTYMDDNRAWIPMMLFSGIMNMMFFMTMMSFVGMAMSPAESAFTGGAEGAGGEDMQQVSDDSGAGADADFGGGDIGGDFSF